MIPTPEPQERLPYNTRPVNDQEAVLLGDHVIGLQEIAPRIVNGDLYRREYVVYDFERERGIWLSSRERVLCNTYVETGSLYACMKKYKMFTRRGTTDKAIKRYLSITHVREYLVQLLKDRGITKGMTRERWIREAQEYRDGRKPSNGSTNFMHKLIGQACGYLTPDMQITIENKQNIEFTQADGSQ